MQYRLHLRCIFSSGQREDCAAKDGNIVFMRNILRDSRHGFATSVLMVGRTAASGLPLPDGCGFTATACLNEQNALKLLYRDRHRAVLFDLNEFGAGGKVLLETICADFPETAVVVITPPAKLHHGLLAMIAGASGYIQPPLLPKNVADSLHRALKRKELDSATRG